MGPTSIRFRRAKISKPARQRAAAVARGSEREGGDEPSRRPDAYEANATEADGHDEQEREHEPNRLAGVCGREETQGHCKHLSHLERADPPEAVAVELRQHHRRPRRGDESARADRGGRATADADRPGIEPQPGERDGSGEREEVVSEPAEGDDDPDRDLGSTARVGQLA